jgi:predicted GTPase
MDGSSREMGTTFTLLTGKLKKMLRKERLMVIVNQADCAMHSHEKFFTNTKHNTTPELIAFLEEKVISIKNRIAESTGFSIAKPLYYSAKYKYNIKTIFDSILDTILSRIHRNKTL